MKTKITFLRHAQTDANRDGNFNGSLDLPLNDTGKQQAIQAASVLRDQVFDVIVYGKAKRVVETTEAVMDMLIKKPETVVCTNEIREMDFGVFEGMHYREISQQYPEEWQRYMDNWQTYAFPQGDSVSTYYSDCGKWIGGIVRRYKGKNILVVGHKGFILNCLSALLTQDGGDVLSRDIKNAETVTLTL